MTVAVFDTNVLLQALARPLGPAGTCGDLVRAGTITMLWSAELEEEVRAKLASPKLRRMIPQSKFQEAEQTLNEILVHVVIPESIPEILSDDRDPDDAMFLNLAAAGSADAIISWDDDLKDLNESDDETGAALRGLLPAIRILTPVEFLKALRNPPDSNLTP